MLVTRHTEFVAQASRRYKILHYGFFS